MPEQLTERQVDQLKNVARFGPWAPFEDRVAMVRAGMVIENACWEYTFTDAGRQALAEHDAKEGRDGK